MGLDEELKSISSLLRNRQYDAVLDKVTDLKAEYPDSYWLHHNELLARLGRNEPWCLELTVDMAMRWPAHAHIALHLSYSKYRNTNVELKPETPEKFWAFVNKNAKKPTSSIYALGAVIERQCGHHNKSLNLLLRAIKNSRQDKQHLANYYSDYAYSLHALRPFDSLVFRAVANSIVLDKRGDRLSENRRLYLLCAQQEDGRVEKEDDYSRIVSATSYSDSMLLFLKKFASKRYQRDISLKLESKTKESVRSEEHILQLNSPHNDQAAYISPPKKLFTKWNFLPVGKSIKTYTNPIHIGRFDNAEIRCYRSWQTFFDGHQYRQSYSFPAPDYAGLEATVAFEEVTLSGTTLSLLAYWSPANYCHFILDTLPRALLAKKQGFEFDKILIEKNGPTYIEQFLKLLFPEAYVVYATDRSIVKAEKLINVSPLNHPAHGAHPEIIELLNGLIEDVDTSFSGERVFLQRPANRRGLKNEAEFLALIERYGFRPVRTEQLSPKQELALFKGTSHVMGVHGAGLANMIFMPKGNNVIELFQRGYGVASFHILAAAMGHKYAAIEETNWKLSGSNPSMKFDQVEPNLEVLEAALQAAGC